MRFWDTSAASALLVSESRSGDLLRLLRVDEAMVVWWGTRIECVSAIRRREREGKLDEGTTAQATGRLATFAANWSEVSPGEVLRGRAERALAVHPLRAGDALQLAAALGWRGESAARHEFVCTDERLRDAASREGFAVLPA